MRRIKMKVHELIEKLSTLDPELVVVLSVDEEGNGYHEVTYIETNHTIDKYNEVYIAALTPKLIDQGYTEECLGDTDNNLRACVVLWP
jgi:hypothetical protein